jgi:hypothetical protein
MFFKSLARGKVRQLGLPQVLKRVLYHPSGPRCRTCVSSIFQSPGSRCSGVPEACFFIECDAEVCIWLVYLHHRKMNVPVPMMRQKWGSLSI